MISSSLTSAGISLRPIAAEDRALLFQVYAGTRVAELALTNWDEAQKETFLQQQFATQHDYYQANYCTTRFLVVERQGVPVGRLYLDRWKDQIRIVDIALLPEQRGQGVGTLLLEAIQDEGRQAGLPVTIHAERFNPALHWYERLGFQLAEDKGVYLFLRWTPPAGSPEVGQASSDPDPGVKKESSIP